MQKISPFLWFNYEAEEAVNTYVKLFKDSRILNVSRYGETGPGPAGSVMVISFQLSGHEFLALNGGPRHSFTEAISFVINCETQEEIDHYWNSLSIDGTTQPCGWLKDRFGLSWQIVPTLLGKLVSDKDTEKANRVMNAMLKMEKIDLDALQKAYDG